MPDKRVCVTGAGGLCGARLVEMLLDKGAERVNCLEVGKRPAGREKLKDERVHWHEGDVSRMDDVRKAVAGCDCVYHMAALVGPYHPRRKYELVNRIGSENVVAACQELGVGKIVFSSSPSTRMDGSNLNGAKETDLSVRAKGEFLERYAETKAEGEAAILAADGTETVSKERLRTVAVAPHQVYGPYDGLFLLNFLRAAPRLRVISSGKNRISMTYVDNYCHALMLADDDLSNQARSAGKFYIVTDDESVFLWDVLDDAISRLTPCTPPKKKLHVPRPVAMLLARVLQAISSVTGRVFKFTPFAAKMLSIDRVFDISAAKRDLGYSPIVPFRTAWPLTIQWFDKNRSFWQ